MIKVLFLQVEVCISENFLKFLCIVSREKKEKSDTDNKADKYSETDVDEVSDSSADK